MAELLYILSSSSALLSLAALHSVAKLCIPAKSLLRAAVVTGLSCCAENTMRLSSQDGQTRPGDESVLSVCAHFPCQTDTLSPAASFLQRSAHAEETPAANQPLFSTEPVLLRTLVSLCWLSLNKICIEAPGSEGTTINIYLQLMSVSAQWPSSPLTSLTASLSACFPSCGVTLYLQRTGGVFFCMYE